MTTAPEASRTASALGALRANRNFRRLWIGQILSDLGTRIGALAYPLLVLALTHWALLAGAVGTRSRGIGIRRKASGGRVGRSPRSAADDDAHRGVRMGALALLAVLVNA